MKRTQILRSAAIATAIGLPITTLVGCSNYQPPKDDTHTACTVSGKSIANDDWGDRTNYLSTTCGTFTVPNDTVYGHIFVDKTYDLTTYHRGNTVTAAQETAHA